tara:strand:+ start:101 stop:592 length:492 start_codon:yes stop_codon:yes gene_type:complete
MGRVFFNTREHTHEITASTTAYQCLASDSNKTFILNTAAATVITLPADADMEIGWNVKFVMALANNNGVLIKCSDVTDTTGQMFTGGLNYQVVADATADVFQGYATAATDDSQLALDTNLANNMASVGSVVNIMKTATNKFMVSGHIASVDADGTGAAIFSNI